LYELDPDQASTVRIAGKGIGTCGKLRPWNGKAESSAALAHTLSGRETRANLGLGLVIPLSFSRTLQSAIASTMLKSPK